MDGVGDDIISPDFCLTITVLEPRLNDYGGVSGITLTF